MSSARSAILTGYVALDVIRHNGSVRQVSGGTAANVAANLVYLGWTCELLGRVGADAQGRRVRHILSKSGVDLGAGFLDPTVETPVVIHEVEAPRHRFLFRCPSCARKSPRFSPPDPAKVDIALPVEMPFIVFADRTSTFAADLFREFNERALLVLEPSSRGHAKAAGQCAELADILKWSHELRDKLHPGVLEVRAHQLQIETLGADGLRFRFGGDRWRHLPAPEIEVIDAAGAGDWLTASFLNELPDDGPSAMSQRELSAALEVGQQTAAFSCLYPGARGCAAVSYVEMQAARNTLSRGQSVTVPPATLERRGRAAGVCPVCLGPI